MAQETTTDMEVRDIQKDSEGIKRKTKKRRVIRRVDISHEIGLQQAPDTGQLIITLTYPPTSIPEWDQEGFLEDRRQSVQENPKGYVMGFLKNTHMTPEVRTKLESLLDWPLVRVKKGEGEGFSITKNDVKEIINEVKAYRKKKAG